MITAPHRTTSPSRSGSRRANVLPSGHLLDEYRIEAILGAGGFGVTYKALDTHLETWVAIKEYFPVEWSFRDADGVTVRPNTQGQTSALEGQESDYHWGLERFLDEARVLARIQHPYVVRVKRYFRAHGTAYIVMDYEEGEPLSAILRDDETFDEFQVRGLLEDVLPALQAVHEQGYLHRDIKPANLYLRSADHRVMLIDFGAARAAVGRHSRSVTSLVTPGYSPPEQYTTRNDRYGTWTDIYALGAVLYRCATGRVPTEAAERMLDDCLEPATQACMGRYSRNLLRVIDQALAVRPEQRFRTVAEMQAALNGASDEDSDETIMRPLPVKPTVPAWDAIRPLLTERPVVPMIEPGTEPGLLEITQPPVGSPAPSDSHHALVRHLKNAAPSQHRPPLGLLIGGGVVAVLAAMIVWFWPLPPEPKQVPPPHHGLNQSESPVAKIVDGKRAMPEPSESFSPGLAPPGAMVDTLPVEPPAVMEPSISPTLGIETEVSIPSPESPASEAAVMEFDPVDAEPDALEQDPVWVDVEPDSLLEVDGAVVQPLPEQPAGDKAVPTENPSEPGTAGVAGGLPVPAAVPPARPRSEATSEPAANRKPPPRRTTAQSRPRKAGQGKTEPRPIIVTPPERRRQSGFRAPRNPWQPPTDTGFNQK